MPTGACWRSRGSAPGPCGASLCSGAATWTRCRPGTSAYIKLVGRLAGLGRRATVAEVEEFYAPYEPYRGLAGAITLAGLYRLVAQGPPLRLAT